jgi:hypothetical protein
MKIEQLDSKPPGTIFTHEVLEDGTVKTTSGKIAMPIHSKGEALLRDLVAGLNSGKGANSRKNLPHTHHDTGLHTHGSDGVQH